MPVGNSSHDAWMNQRWCFLWVFFFVCFLNGFWLVVGGTLQKLDAKVPTSPGTKKVKCVDSGPGDPSKTPICSSKS